MARCRKHGGTAYIPWRECDLCQEEETRDRLETLIDSQQNWDFEDNQVTSDAACGHCGQTFVESTRKFPKRGWRWAGRLAFFRKKGICPKCYFDLKEKGYEIEWTEVEWRTFWERKLAKVTTSKEAKHLQTNQLKETFPDIAGQIYRLIHDLEAKELAALENQRIEEAKRRQEEEARRRQLELESKRREEEEARRRQLELESKRREEEEARRRQQELESKRREEEEARRRQQELESKRREEEEARREFEAKKRQEEETRQRTLQLEAKKQQEEQARQRQGKFKAQERQAVEAKQQQYHEPAKEPVRRMSYGTLGDMVMRPRASKRHEARKLQEEQALQMRKRIHAWFAALGVIVIAVSALVVLNNSQWSLRDEKSHSIQMSLSQEDISVGKYGLSVLRQINSRSATLSLVKSGIVARGVDNEIKIVSDPVDEAAWDPFYEILWFSTNNRLEAIDFRQENATRIIVAEKIPDAQLRIYPPHDRMSHGIVSENRNDDRNKIAIGLSWKSGHPELIDVNSVEYCADGKEDNSSKKASRSKIERPRLVAINWLTSLATRALNRYTEVKKFEGRINLDPKSTKCDGYDGCGGSMDCNSYVLFGANNDRLFVVSSVCGDYCEVLCFVARSRGFTNPIGSVDFPSISTGVGPHDGQPCGSYYFNNYNDEYIIGNKICHDIGRCRDDNGVLLGWVNPGPVIEGAGSNWLR